MRTRRLDFAEFYREVKNECLLTVLVSVGDRDTALNAGISRWLTWRLSRTGPRPAGALRLFLEPWGRQWRRRSP